MALAVKLLGHGGYDRMKVEKIDYPENKPNSVIVEMKACGVNFCDILNRQGIFTYKDMKPPFILGVEGAGIIKEIGSNVQNLKVDDRVMCWNFTYGMFSTHVCIPARQCHKIPDKMSFKEAAAMPINYVTAYFTLLRFGNLNPGESVLIQCAAGGVGWATTQLARTVPDVTIFGTATASKHIKILENGVTHAIDYMTTDFVEEVFKLSPHGVDVVVDCLSGNDFIRGKGLLKDMGRIIHIGINSAVSGEYKSWWNLLKVWWQTKTISIDDLIAKNHGVCGLHLANVHERQPKLFKLALDDLLKLYMEGKIKPEIDSTWNFNEVEDAQKQMLQRKNIGKIILIPEGVPSKSITPESPESPPRSSKKRDSKVLKQSFA